MEIKKQLVEELNRLERIAQITEEELKNAPEGTLRLSKSQGSVQYYHGIEGSSRHGVYIPKKDMSLVQQLAQKSYNEKIHRYASKSSGLISRLLKEYDDDKIEEIYRGEHSQRQELIIPVEPTYEMKLSRWMEKTYINKGFSENAPVILTNNGVRVRSKSEKILADYFESVGLLYKYECPINLKPFGTIYPDFTFLSRKTGEEIYWEHEGMLDNPEYAGSAVKKIELYEKNGILPGERLILTFETSSSVVSTEIIKILTKRYLL